MAKSSMISTNAFSLASLGMEMPEAKVDIEALKQKYHM